MMNDDDDDAEDDDVGYRIYCFLLRLELCERRTSVVFRASSKCIPPCGRRLARLQHKCISFCVVLYRMERRE
jgi:hypothetical protein